jgi:hypothetical protein
MLPDRRPVITPVDAETVRSGGVNVALAVALVDLSNALEATEAGLAAMRRLFEERRKHAAGQG